MITSNNKWLIHTILVGIIPILTRLLTWAITSSGKVDPLTAADFITLGLVIHISILNETEHLMMHESAIRALLNVISRLFVTSYGALYTLTTLSERNRELINAPSVIPISIILCVGSAISGLTLFHIAKRRPE